MDNSIVGLLSVVLIIVFMLYLSKGKEVKTTKQILDAALTSATNKANADIKIIESLQIKINDLYLTIPSLANKQFDEFRKNEIDNLKSVLTHSARQSALAELENWKAEYETYYRQDAINRSKSVIIGKVTEHLVPFKKDFPYNPKEARFIGSPIDLIVFHGLEEEGEVEVHIIEIKTGKSALSKRQKLIKNAIDNGRVYWRQLTI